MDLSKCTYKNMGLHQYNRRSSKVNWCLNLVKPGPCPSATIALPLPFLNLATSYAAAVYASLEAGVLGKSGWAGYKLGIRSSIKQVFQ